MEGAFYPRGVPVPPGDVPVPWEPQNNVQALEADQEERPWKSLELMMRQIPESGPTGRRGRTPVSRSQLCVVGSLPLANGHSY